MLKEIKNADKICAEIFPEEDMNKAMRLYFQRQKTESRAWAEDKLLETLRLLKAEWENKENSQLVLSLAEWNALLLSSLVQMQELNIFVLG